MNENLAYLAKKEFHHDTEFFLKIKDFELTVKNAVLEINLKVNEKANFIYKDADRESEQRFNSNRYWKIIKSDSCYRNIDTHFA